jgi:UDP-3-O-[3-hydroxymyristoyl] glucosamine N-acyltransferase
MAGEPRAYSLQEIVERLGGELVGDPQTKVWRVAALDSATPDSITFLANERYASQLGGSRAGVVIVGEAMREATRLPRVVCSNPHAYFARVSVLFNPPADARPGKHPTAVIDPSAVIAPDAEIGPLVIAGRNVRIGKGSVISAGCFLGDDTRVGDHARLFANVTVYHGCAIGDRVIVHAGAVIGADGFGIALENERWVKVPQIGGVVIGSDVEIGANTTIDRGAIDDTVIEEGVKLDNQIQIGHNVRIGAHTAIAACTGIAGSTKIGRHCRIGGASGIAGHIVITDNVEISAYTAVTKSIDRPGRYTAVYAFEPHAQWLRNAVQLRHLGELADRVRELEKKLANPKRSGS